MGLQPTLQSRKEWGQTKANQRPAECLPHRESIQNTHAPATQALAGYSPRTDPPNSRRRDTARPAPTSRDRPARRAPAVHSPSAETGNAGGAVGA